MGSGRHLVAYPLRGGRVVNLVAVERRDEWAEEGWTHPDLPETVRAAFAGWAPEVRALLAGLDSTFLWGLFDHPPLPEWTRGRLALLGDACHPMLPFLAQGATMALEDAWVLAQELDLAADPGDGLIAYEDRRRARATAVQRAAARNGRVYHLPPPASLAAQAALSAASRLAPGLLLGRFDWVYGADVVSHDPGT
jgi:salicylate hydroxylase